MNNITPNELLTVIAVSIIIVTVFYFKVDIKKFL